MARKSVKVIQDQDKPVEKEVLADAIIKISESMSSFTSRSGLNRRAIVTLIADDTRLGKGTIEAVIDSLSELRKLYCSK